MFNLDEIAQEAMQYVSEDADIRRALNPHLREKAAGPVKKSKRGCGANADGGGGFQKGNTCASDKEGDSKLVQNGLFGDEYEAGKFTESELAELTGMVKPKPPKARQSVMFDGMNDHPDQGFLFDEQSEVAVKQTDTPEFNEWFADSKVVDAKGEPKEVYHGTDKFIGDSFDRGKLGTNTQAAPSEFGFWFTDSEYVAEGYAEQAIYRPMFELEMQLELAESAEERKRLLNESLKMGQKIDRSGDTGEVLPVFLSLQNPMTIDSKSSSFRDTPLEEYAKQAIDEGHDGLIVENLDDTPMREGREATHYLVFDPKRIKSSKDNSGKFNPDSESIRKAVGLNTFTGESGGSLVNANEPKQKCGTDAECDCECDPEPIQKAIAPLDELSGRLEGLWEKLESSGELEGLSDDVLALLKLVDESTVDEISKSKHEPIKKSGDCGANADGGGGFQPGNTCGGGGGDSSGGGKGSSNDGMNSERSMVSKVSSWLAGTSNKDDLDHKMASSVDGSGDLKKSKVFKEAVKKATSKMSDSAAKEAMANIKEVDFFDSARDLTKKALELHPEMAEFVPEGSVIAGIYTEGGKMLLNGGAETGDAEGATHGTYLHELVHAMDKGDKVAHSDDWLIAWNREMRGGQLTEYGASSPVEGLAEFGRVLFDEGEEAVKQKYPRSLKIFKNKGWVK